MNLIQKVVAKSAGIPQQTISNIIFGIGVVIALILAAQITWKLVPVSEQTSAWQPMPMNTSSGGSSFELSAVQNLALFGKADADAANKAKAQPVEQITDAPKTSLSILLTGVVASTAQSNGLAVIESKGSQETYKLGDRIKGTSASLKEVYADRIIITNSGRYETLMLDGLKYTANSPANQPLQQAKSQQVQQLDKRDNSEFSQTLADSRDELLADPSKLTDFIAISPVRSAEGMIGYRLNPGKDLALFSAAGFKANDLAKTINGYDLTDMSQGLEVMAQLPELTEMSVMVEREGQLIEIMFSLPEQ